MKNHTIQRLSYGLMSFVLAITFLVSGCGGVPPHPSSSSTSIHVQSKSLLVGAWLGIPSTFTEPVAAFTAAIHQFEVDSGHHMVDYVAIDGFNWGTSQLQQTWQSFKNIFSPAYRAIDDGMVPGSCDTTTISKFKPVFIPEWASAEKGGEKATWITDAFHQIKARAFPRVQGLFWFNQDKTGQQETDWRIDSSPAARDAFVTMAKDPYFNP